MFFSFFGRLTLFILCLGQVLAEIVLLEEFCLKHFFTVDDMCYNIIFCLYCDMKYFENKGGMRVKNENLKQKRRRKM